MLLQHAPMFTGLILKHRLFSKLIMALALVGAVAVFAGRGELGLFATASAQEAKAADGADLQDYKLGAGDQVRITVYGEKDLTGEFAVSGSGRISFPLIGDIEAGGHTIHEVEQVVTAKLKDGYLVDPKVACEVLVFRPYYILGEVNKPGQYPYTSGLTALKAVATAQGFTYRANSKKIFIRHAGEDKEHEYSLRDMVYIQPGDTMRVAERYF